jgi:hypothetical protein
MLLVGRMSGYKRGIVIPKRGVAMGEMVRVQMMSSFLQE